MTHLYARDIETFLTFHRRGLPCQAALAAVKALCV